MKKPEIKKDISIEDLKESIDSYLDDLANLEVCEDQQSDYQYNIWETAVTMIYGEEVWDYINYWIEQNEDD